MSPSSIFAIFHEPLADSRPPIITQTVLLPVARDLYSNKMYFDVEKEKSLLVRSVVYVSFQHDYLVPNTPRAVPVSRER